jgi:hypothetical protein
MVMQPSSLLGNVFWPDFTLESSTSVLMPKDRSYRTSQEGSSSSYPTWISVFEMDFTEFLTLSQKLPNMGEDR